MGSEPRIRYQRQTAVPSASVAVERRSALLGVARAASDAFAEALEAAETRADTIADAEGSKAGARAAAAGDLREADYSTIRGRAFNRAMLTTGAAQATAKMRTGLLDLQREYRDDPGGFRAAAGAFMDGAVADLQRVDPEAAAALRAQGDVQAAATAQTILDKAAAKAREQADASLVALGAAQDAVLDQATRQIYAGSPTASENWLAVVEEQRADLERQLNAVDAEGKPIYSPADVATTLQEFDRDVHVRGLTSLLLSLNDDDLADAAVGLTDGTFEAALGDPAAGTYVNATMVVGEQGRAQLQQVAISELNRRNSAAKAAETEAERQRTAAQERAEFDFHFRFAGFGEPLTPVELQAAVRSGAVRGGRVEGLAGALATALKPRDETVPSVAEEVARQFYIYQSDPHDIMEWMASNADQFSASDYRAWLERLAIAARPEDGGFLTEEQRAVFGTLKTSLEETGLLSDKDPAALDRMFQMEMEFYRRVAKGGEDATAVAHDLRERAKSRNAFSIGLPSDALMVPRFAAYADDGTIDIAGTATALVAAFERGEISAAEVQHQERLLMRWQEAGQ